MKRNKKKISTKKNPNKDCRKRIILGKKANVKE